MYPLPSFKVVVGAVSVSMMPPTSPFEFSKWGKGRASGKSSLLSVCIITWVMCYVRRVHVESGRRIKGEALGINLRFDQPRWFKSGGPIGYEFIYRNNKQFLSHPYINPLLSVFSLCRLVLLCALLILLLPVPRCALRPARCALRAAPCALRPFGPF
jgi:hypothetical protein